ncbi:DinB family protein [Sinomicrobium weinanense]|uniref:DUF1572 family protein n=1 Tax=Sinomicrobium weinanense TaxID=2842200 RepID=A0A926JPG0_9FLAO|nr:DinB family protein [Sinomicrobium weinanense]MBC9794826.1 DUF1572 family protein [Sinomicrobium weinanense]MBU3125085.1 DUF1572 domain-containing protein [Sinomicrobium weinanense]
MSNSNYLDSVKKQFLHYKSLGDKTFQTLSDNDIHWHKGEEDNSIAIIVKHLAGNMLSRWTNFFTQDGEKEWRHRDNEFTDTYTSVEDMKAGWEAGWTCFLDTLNSIRPEDLERSVYIRGKAHTVTEAINRQLAHYPYHIGQIVHIAKQLKDEDWKSLSIPRGASSEYNKTVLRTKEKS